MKVVYLLNLVGLILIGCSSNGSTASTTGNSVPCPTYTKQADCTAATYAGTACAWNGTACVTSVTKCTDIVNQTLCAGSTFSGSGCYWTAPATGASGPTGCLAATNCSNPTTQTACVATSQGTTACTWGNYGCYLKAATTCNSFLSKDTCQVSSTAGDYCFWNGTICQAAKVCSDLKDADLCTNAPLKGGSLCNWTAISPCTVNSSGLCTPNSSKRECCAGSDTSCTVTDASCSGPPSGNFFYPKCDTNTTTAKCNLNSTNPISSRANRFCCSGTDTACDAPNPNCTFSDLAGTCG